ncbi:AAA domain-containing protein [Spiroplasma endosymbiont of Amphibalanus improvisus]|uniref:AAA domain-containing protein n=1 Tax=Spiroplasma endosymbiont of Amphibalanus improvisus TaxID=3066327 RepID=UPI00313ED419
MSFKNGLVDNKNIIQNKNDNQFLFINAYSFINSEKITDDDVYSLGMEDINTKQHLVEKLNQGIVSDFFVTLINNKVFLKGKKEIKTQKMLIRFVDLPEFNELLPKNNYLSATGDLEIESGIFRVSDFFISSKTKEPEYYETYFKGFGIKCDNKGFSFNEAVSYSVFNSQNLKLISPIPDFFSDIKKNWDEFLEFQILDNNYKSKQIQLFQNPIMFDVLKIKKNDHNEKLIHANKIKYVENISQGQDIYINNPTNEHIQLFNSVDEIKIIRCDFIYKDLKDLEVIRKLPHLVLGPLSLNKKLNNDEKLDFFNFDLDADKINNEEIHSLFGIIQINKNNILNDHYLNEYNFDKNKKISLNYLRENNLKISHVYLESEDTNVLNFNEGYLVSYNKGSRVLIKRIQKTLKAVSENKVTNPYLTSYLFDIQNLKNSIKNEDIKNDNIDWKTENLNSEQKIAIKKALKSKDLFIVQGPPGTGKTQLITELIHQFVERGKKILLSSQNHVAIDNVLERINSDPKILPLRLTNNNVKRKNVVTDFNPERITYNHLRFIYLFLLNKYIKKIDFYSYDLQQYQNEFKKIHGLFKKHAEVLKDLEIKRKDYNKLNSEVEILNEHSTKKTKINLEKQIYFLETFQNAIKNKVDLNFVIPLFDKLKILFIKNFSNIYKTLFDAELLDTEESASGLYKKIFEKLNTSNDELNETINFLEKRIFDNKTILAQNNVKILQEKINNEIKVFEKEIEILKNIKELKSKDGFNNLFINFLKDLNSLKSNLEKSLKDLSHENNLKVKIAKILHLKEELNIDKAKIRDLDDKLKSLILKFNKNLKISIPVEVSENSIKILKENIDKEISNKKIIEELKKYEPYVKGILSFLNKNFDLKNIIENNKYYKNFNNDLIKTTKKYSQKLLDKYVNLIAMTATANNIFSPNNMAKELLIGEIDIKKFNFDVVIIDESSKLTLMEIMMPLIYGKSVILLGDYRQLPPIFNYYKEEIEKINKEFDRDFNFLKFKKLITESIFKTLVHNSNNSIKESLKKQYRFSSSIMKIVNLFYDGTLEIGDINQDNLKRHQIQISNSKGQTVFSEYNSIYWIDSFYDETSKVHYEESEKWSTSLFNSNEIKQTIRALELINKSCKLSSENSDSFKKPSVAVISFYALHVQKLKKDIKKQNFKYFNLNVSTVDDFQGKEADIVIVNIIRNPKNANNFNAEFIQNFERMNVAFSRARKMLIIVGAVGFLANREMMIPDFENPFKIKKEKIYRKILDLIEEYGKKLNWKDIK